MMSHDQNEEIGEMVIKFLARFLSVPPNRIHFDSSIARDFGVAGQDGMDLMEEFAREFSVAMDGFNCGDYFGSEGLNILDLFREFTPLSVGDLIESARAGKWNAV